MKAGRRSFQTLQPLCDLIQSQLMIPDLTMLFAAFRLCEDTLFYRPCIWQTALKSFKLVYGNIMIFLSGKKQAVLCDPVGNASQGMLLYFLIKAVRAFRMGDILTLR